MTKDTKLKAYTVHEAKTHLSAIIRLVEQGHEVIITRSHHPVAKLVSVKVGAVNRRFGALKGRVRVDPSFFEPLPEHELEAWER